MKSTLERASLLSLSLMMVSTFAVSPALPQMIAHFKGQGYTASQIERLIPISSFAILAILLLTPLINRLLKERAIIVIGLLLLSVGGSLPILLQSYPLLLTSRLLLGVGIGLLNARAINVISERFTGADRKRMLGIRGSMEVLGSALLTFFAGQLAELSWSLSFAIYGFGFLIMTMYLLFVPDSPQESTVDVKRNHARLSGRQFLYLTGLAVYAGFIILVNSSATIRIPQIVAQLHLGTVAQSSILLSVMMIMGILAGMLYAPLTVFLGRFFQIGVTVIFALGCLILWGAHDWLFLTIGALLMGFFYSLAVTFAFHMVAEKIPLHLIATATTLVLLGCNVGGGSTALVLQFLTLFAPAPTAVFGLYALLTLVIVLFLLVVLGQTKKKRVDQI